MKDRPKATYNPDPDFWWLYKHLDSFGALGNWVIFMAICSILRSHDTIYDIFSWFPTFFSQFPAKTPKGILKCSTRIRSLNDCHVHLVISVHLMAATKKAIKSSLVTCLDLWPSQLTMEILGSITVVRRGLPLMATIYIAVSSRAIECQRE